MGKQGSKVNRDSIDALPDQVAADLAKRIKSGSIPPGRRLDPVAIGKAYGVARRTASRAVTLLASSGQVTIKPGRGAYVAREAAK